MYSTLITLSSIVAFAAASAPAASTQHFTLTMPSTYNAGTAGGARTKEYCSTCAPVANSWVATANDDQSASVECENRSATYGKLRLQSGTRKFMTVSGNNYQLEETYSLYCMPGYGRVSAQGYDNDACVKCPTGCLQCEGSMANREVGAGKTPGYGTTEMLCTRADEGYFLNGAKAEACTGTTDAQCSADDTYKAGVSAAQLCPPMNTFTSNEEAQQAYTTVHTTAKMSVDANHPNRCSNQPNSFAGNNAQTTGVQTIGNDQCQHDNLVCALCANGSEPNVAGVAGCVTCTQIANARPGTHSTCENLAAIDAQKPALALNAVGTVDLDCFDPQSKTCAKNNPDNNMCADGYFYTAPTRGNLVKVNGVNCTDKTTQGCSQFLPPTNASCTKCANSQCLTCSAVTADVCSSGNAQHNTKLLCEGVTPTYTSTNGDVKKCQNANQPTDWKNPLNGVTSTTNPCAGFTATGNKWNGHCTRANKGFFLENFRNNVGGVPRQCLTRPAAVLGALPGDLPIADVCESDANLKLHKTAEEVCPTGQEQNDWVLELNTTKVTETCKACGANTVTDNRLPKIIDAVAANAQTGVAAAPKKIHTYGCISCGTIANQCPDATVTCEREETSLIVDGKGPQQTEASLALNNKFTSKSGTVLAYGTRAAGSQTLHASTKQATLGCTCNDGFVLVGGRPSGRCEGTIESYEEQCSSMKYFNDGAQWMGGYKQAQQYVLNKCSDPAHNGNQTACVAANATWQEVCVGLNGVQVGTVPVNNTNVKPTQANCTYPNTWQVKQTIAEYCMANKESNTAGDAFVSRNCRYKPRTDDQCLPCADSNCRECTSHVKEGTCTKAAAGYYLANNKLVNGKRQGTPVKCHQLTFKQCNPSYHFHKFEEHLMRSPVPQAELCLSGTDLTAPSRTAHTDNLGQPHGCSYYHMGCTLLTAAQKARLDEQYHNIDRDNNGIDRHHVGNGGELAALKELLQGTAATKLFTNDEVNAVVASMDLNDDERITELEFNKYFEDVCSLYGWSASQCAVREAVVVSGAGAVAPSVVAAVIATALAFML